MVERDHYFVCRLEDFFSSQQDCWIWWFEFVFLVNLSKLTIQCVITIYKHDFCRLIVHFVSIL
jgi:hypothetical protein